MGCIFAQHSALSRARRSNDERNTTMEAARSHLRLTILFLSLFTGVALTVSANELPEYRNAKLPVEKRVADLLARMTVEEKVGQLGFALGWPMYEKHGNQIG